MSRKQTRDMYKDLYPNIRTLYLKVARKDGDWDGGLGIGKWSQIIREGVPEWRGSDADIAELFLEMNHNEDDVVTFEEFCRQMVKPKLDDSKKGQCDSLLRKWDKDGDSMMSREELNGVLSKYRPNVREKIIDNIMETADVDKDGEISVEEFYKIVFGKKR